jgi:ectoine hydroxylase-related dioxygenase (phytanoyl-CoA dioxygenase family)
VGPPCSIPARSFTGSAKNKSDRVRQAINITYAVGWVRQEENQFLSTPIEVAKALPDDLLRLVEYQLGLLARLRTGRRRPDGSHPGA